MKTEQGVEMVAVAHQGHRARPRHLRLVTDGYDEAAARRRRERELAVLRRRLVAVALVVGLLVALGLALGRAGSARSAGVGTEPGVAAGALPIAQAEYVVQPGDTLWKIARALQPEGDVRPLVYELGRARSGAPLRPGERITLP